MGGGGLVLLPGVGLLVVWLVYACVVRLLVSSVFGGPFDVG